MKRAARPFVVEVRRGQKKAPLVEPEPIPDASRDDALRRAEAALFEGRGTGPSTVRSETSEPGEPARRILQNLAEVDPLTVLLADEAPARRRGRKPGSKNKPKLPRTEDAVEYGGSASARHVELTPDVVHAAFQSMAKAAPAAIPERRAEANAPTLRAADGAAPARPRIFPVAKSAPWPISVEPAARPPAASGATNMLRTRSKIMDVYVFKTEPKPWEIWKRRLRGLPR